MRTIHLSLQTVMVLACLGGAPAVRAQFDQPTKIGGGVNGSIVTNVPGSYTVVGGGNDIWDISDEFTFHFTEVEGDFDVKVRVESLEKVARWTKAGLMARESTTCDSRMTFVRVTPSPPGNFANDVRFSYRTGRDEQATGGGYNGGAHEDPTNNFLAPAYSNAWLRLERSGNVMRAYSGTNGSNWTLLGSQNTSSWQTNGVPRPLADTLLLGLAVSRHPSGTATTARAEFRNFSDTTRTPPQIAQQPDDANVREGQPGRFSVQMRQLYDPTMTFQWWRSGVAIPGATGRVYTTPPTTLSDDGSRFRVRITNALGQTVSSERRLEVLPNPALLGASTRGNPNGVFVFFSEELDASSALVSTNYTMNNGAMVSGVEFVPELATNGPQSAVLVRTSPLADGASYTLTVRYVRDLAGNLISPSTSSAAFIHGAGYELRRITLRGYDGICGATLADLQSAPAYPASPSRVSARSLFEVPTDVDDFYGASLSGYYVAPLSGNYRFHLCSDDQGALYLARDAERANKVLIAFEPEWNAARDYTGTTRRPNLDNRTNSVPLSAGQRVYLEAVFQEFIGGDNLSVGVQLPGGSPPTAPISESEFAPLRQFGGVLFNTLGPVSLAPLSDRTVALGETTTFSAAVDGTPPYAMQWFSNGVPILGATGPSYTTPPATPAMHNASYRVSASNEFSEATRVAALRLATRPRLVTAEADCWGNKVTVTFNEPLLPASVFDPFGYEIFDASGLVEITNIELRADGRTLCLFVERPFAAGYVHTLRVSSVRNAGGTEIAPNSTITFGCRFYDAVIVTVTNTTGRAAGDLRVTFSGANGSLFVDPNSVLASGCPVAAVPSNGAETNTAVLSWSGACVAPGTVVIFRAVTTNGPLSVIGASWTDASGQNIGSALATARRRTVLIFEPSDDLQPVPPAYGDRVTASPDADGYRYGPGSGATPNVVVDYGPLGSSVLEGPSGYGDLNGVAYQEDGDFGVLELTLIADPGFLVVLEGFDLAGLGCDTLVAGLEVRDGTGAELFSQPDALIVGEDLTHAEFRFPSPTLSGQRLILRVDVSNLDDTDSHLVGLDNVQFSQVSASCPLPPPRLAMVRAGGSLVASWAGSGYCLQGTAALADPPSATAWMTLPGASPVIVPVTGPSQFFRLICPCP